MIQLLKSLFHKPTHHPQYIIGCYTKNTVYYCDIGNGNKCGLLCEVEHGDYIYSAKEETSGTL